MSAAPSPAPAPAPANWIPDRKVVAGGLAGIITWAAMLAAGQFLGVHLDPSLQPAIATAVGTLIAYATPPSLRDKIKRLNDEVVAIAADDPTIPVTKK